MATSTLRMPRSGAQAIPAIGTRPAARPAPSGGVSIRDWVRIGASLDQPQRHPVAVERLERRQLQLGQPLGRRHVAVQARDDEPGREAVHPAAAARRSSSPRSSARAPGPSPRPSASRPSSRPRTDRPAGCADAWTPASSRTSRSRTPVHFALPTSSPPTSLLTQAIVTYCSNIGSPMSSSQVSVVSRSTRPWIRSVQSAVSTTGSAARCRSGRSVVRDDDRREARRCGRQVLRRSSERQRARRPAGAGRRAASGAFAALEERPTADARDDRSDADGRRPGSGTSGATSRASCRWRPSAAVGAGRTEPARGPRAPTPTDTAVATADDRGRRQPGSRSAARKPTTPNAANAIVGDVGRRRRGRRARPRWRARPATMTSSKASLSLVPNRATDDVLGAGRLEVDDDLADGRDQRRGTRAAGRPAARRSEGAPRDGRRRRATAARAWSMSSRAQRAGVRVTLACRAGPRGTVEPRPGPAVLTLHDERHPVRLRQDVGPVRTSSIGPAATTRPAASTSAWSKPGGISSRWWDTSTMAAGRARRRARSGRASRVSRAARSRLAAGSSSRSRSGSGIRARAIETRRRSPADSVPNGWSARAGHPEPRQRRSGPGPGRRRCTRATTARSRRSGRVMTRSTAGRSGRRTASTALPADPTRLRSSRTSTRP